MPYGPHTASDRARMLAALGLTSVDELFDDIPPALRATPLDLPPPVPELELAARLQALAGRNRTDLVSFLGAGVYRHWSPPAVDQLLTDSGVAVRPGLVAVTSPLSGANRSLTALTDSTTPNAADCSSARPTSGNSTKTMSPS